jgi:hypothetical protein
LNRMVKSLKFRSHSYPIQRWCFEYMCFIHLCSI